MEIRIRDEFIKLGQALKLADLVSDGVEAKYVINDGLVKPSAIAKIISEYDTLSFKYLKDKSYNIAKKMLSFIGIISFCIMFLFSDLIAKGIIGGVTDRKSTRLNSSHRT